MKKYWVDNECMIDFIEMYCEGKSFLWRWFFGWRKTSFKPIGNLRWKAYIIPKKIYQEALVLAKKYNEYEVV